MIAIQNIDNSSDHLIIAKSEWKICENRENMASTMEKQESTGK